MPSLICPYTTLSLSIVAAAPQAPLSYLTHDPSTTVQLRHVCRAESGSVQLLVLPAPRSASLGCLTSVDSTALQKIKECIRQVQYFQGGYPLLMSAHPSYVAREMQTDFMMF
jgi:hypothetical protein